VLYVDRIRDQLIRWAKEKPEVEAVALFGSLAKGTIHTGSDLDIFVVARADANDPDDVIRSIDWKEELRLLLGIEEIDLYFPSDQRGTEFAREFHLSVYDPRATPRDSRMSISRLDGEQTMPFFRQSAWSVCRAPKEQFSAQFPAAVVRKFHSILPGAKDDGRSPATVTYTCSVKTGLFSRQVYQTTVTRLLEFYGSPSDLLESSLDFLISQSHSRWKLTERRFVEFQGYPGAEYKFDLGTQQILMGTAVLVGKTLYHLSLRHSAGSQHSFDRFVAEFRIEQFQ
jgi:predicted nucleotidyltransferase